MVLTIKVAAVVAAAVLFIPPMTFSIKAASQS
jgi:hypothetical protein